VTNGCEIFGVGGSQTGASFTVDLNRDARTTVGGTCTITASFTVPSGSPGTYTNPSAVWDWNGASAGGGTQGASTVTNSAPVTILAVPVTITKTASPGTVTTGSNAVVGYTVTFQNTGASNVDLSTIVDNLPDDLFYISGSATWAGVAREPTVTHSSSTDQSLSWSMTGLFIAPGATATLYYEVAVAAGTSPRANTVTLSGSIGGSAVSKTGTGSLTVSSTPDQLWPGASPAGSGVTVNNAARADDDVFDNDYLDTTADDWANDGDTITWATINNDTITTVTGVVAVIRFAVSTAYVDDDFAFEISTDGTGTTWTTIRTFGLGRDEMPPEGAVPGALRTVAVDLTGNAAVLTTTQIGNARFRLRGLGASGGIDTFSIYVESPLLIVSGT
jgi:uncharacterized repeat protein (TIGR01451 family)